MLTSGYPKNKVAKALLKIAHGDTDSIDYDLYKSSGILIENGEYRALELILQEADSAPRDHIRKVISEKDPKLFNKLYKLADGEILALAESKVLKRPKKKVSHSVKDEFKKLVKELNGNLAKANLQLNLRK
jgi:hypothetical protein